MLAPFPAATGTGEQTVKRDRAVILVILGLAVFATVFATWFRWSQGHRAQEYWGVDVARQIRFAPKVELIWLDSPVFSGRPATSQAGMAAASTSDTLMIDGIRWNILKRTDITKARGLVHARQSLIQDATFQWDETTWGPDSSWTHALAISDTAGESITLLFDLGDPTEGFVREQNSQEKIQLTIPQGFKTFFSEQGDPEPDWRY